MKGQKILACIIATMMVVSGLALVNVVTGSQEPQPKPMTVPRCVLLEDFTEWKCGFCPARNAAIRALLEGTPGYGYDVVAPIYYHVWWPGGDDPIYHYNEPENTVRANYYGVPSYGVPETFYDGKNLGQDTAIKAHVDAELAIPADIAITSSGVLDDITNTGTISAHIVAAEDIIDTDLVVHFGLWEHNITRFPGGNEAEYPWAMWDMIPNAAGTPIWTAGASAGQAVDVTYPFTIGADWIADNIGISIWVQDVSSKVVHQAHVEHFSNTPPTVTVLDNNGQAEDGTWTGTESITWTAADQQQPNATLDVKIEYSPDNGGNWFTIEDGTNNNDGVCSWNTATLTDGPNYLLRITVTDDAADTDVDISDAVFTIQNLPSIDLTNPNGGQVWRGGVTYMIWWNVSDLKDPVTALTTSLYYSLDGGVSYPNTIATGIPGITGSDGQYYYWTVPTIDSTLVRVRAIVTDTDALTATDQSLANFLLDSTWALPATNPKAELTGVNDVTITWTASPSPDVAYYLIYAGTSAWDTTGNSYALVPGANTTGTSFVHIAAGNYSGAEYCYQIRTFDQVGHETRTFIQAAKYSKLISASGTVCWGGWVLLGSSIVQSSYTFNYKLQGQGMGMQGYYNWSAVELYNAWDNADHWKLNVRNATASVNEISTINNTQGFWACIYNGVRYTSAGYISNVSIPLKAGWNLVPYPFAVRNWNTMQIRDHLTANCPGFSGTYNDMEVMKRDNPYRLSTPTGTEVLTHQDGFLVRVPADTVWTVINY